MTPHQPSREQGIGAGATELRLVGGGARNALWRQIARTARPGARVIYRTGGAPDILPGRVDAGLLGRWQYDRDASETGFANDRSAIYGGFHLRRNEG